MRSINDLTLDSTSPLKEYSPRLARGEYSFKGEVESKVKSLIERIEEITD